MDIPKVVIIPEQVGVFDVKNHVYVPETELLELQRKYDKLEGEFSKLITQQLIRDLGDS